MCKKSGAIMDIISSVFHCLQTSLRILQYRALSKRWTDIEKNTCIPFEEFISTIKFILSSTFFIFNDTLYKQTFGTPMGSFLSPIIADIVLQDLEEEANIIEYHWSGLALLL